ncbi:MAG: hypothetical protein EHM33_20580 [Chloroflexi bacterium]|jgi:hypothetical protein|nr:MAG: hypothetical protein EHM33_20580 [Chloroflexota bacterium]
MANIYGNIFIHGLADLLGDQFADCRTRSGKTILATNPMFDDDRECAETKESHQDALREATTHANFARRQEVYVNKARGNGATAYSIALIDWFGVPEVLEINVDRWTGKPGQTIRVKARDNVLVAGVTVVIRDAGDNALEIGEAMQSEAGSPWWNYTTRSQVTMNPFPSVEATAWDLPGNCDSFVIS